MKTKTVINKRKVAAVIHKDANLRGMLQGTEPGTYCIVGGLLHYGGFGPRATWTKHETGNSVYALTRKARRFLRKTYGLGIGSLRVLMRENDQWSDTEKRREALLAKLKTL